jgi:carbamoyl-phosphate synthase small subunit
MKTEAILALENGTWYRGESAGAEGVAAGEVVFNTSMTGYQEILTDPSYSGQIVTMTCPEIGNYGVSPKDVESVVPRVAGFIMREESPVASNWRAESTLREYLVANKIVAIAGIDTRALTRVLRSSGVMRGVISAGDVDPKELVERANAIPKMEGADLVRDVTVSKTFDWPQEDPGEFGIEPGRRAKRRLKIAAYDYGMKWNILRRLSAHGCDVTVYPAVLSYAIENAKTLVASNAPVFGICLGHQVLGLAMGGTTFKLKFGHRGANHPVKKLETGKVEITSQNHGFAVDPKSLPADVEVTHLNLYDGTVEGIRHREHPVFAVQYHPEASPGPHDADYLFDDFIEMIEKRHA